MRIEQLQCYLEVVRTGSFTLAAENLFLTQQGLSGAIARLEKELGVVLFIRSKRGAELTEDGAALSGYAAAILEKYAEFEQALAQRLKEGSANLQGTLTLCATAVLSGTFLPDILTVFRERYPKVHLNCLELTAEEIIAQVRRTPSCVGFILTNAEESELQALAEAGEVMLRSVFTDQLAACVSAASPLAVKPFLPLAEFHRQSRISFNYQIKNSPAPGNSGETVYASNNIELHKKLVLQNMAISTVPKRFFGKIFDTKGIIPLGIEPPIPVAVYMVYSPQNISGEIKALEHVLRDYLEKL